MIELYIFDQGGVLSRDFQIAPEASKRLGIDVDRFRWILAPDMQFFMRGEIDTAEVWRRFEARSGLRPPEDYWKTLFHPTLDEDVAVIARELGRNARVVGGTNTIAVHYAIHRALGQYDCLQRVYASHLMGFAKPEPEFWLSILKEEGVRPGRAFFVDDFIENVEGARSLGLEARLFVGAAGLRRDLAALGAPIAAEMPDSVPNLSATSERSAERESR